MPTLLDDLKRELSNLQKSYVRELEGIAERAALAVENAKVRGQFSTHTPFNLSSNCQELQTIASKIEQTKMMINTLENR